MQGSATPANTPALIGQLTNWVFTFQPTNSYASQSYTLRFYFPIGFSTTNPACTLSNYVGLSPTAVYLFNQRIIECRGASKALPAGVS